jgi:tRNA (cmo5U34)-methyltransferase
MSSPKFSFDTITNFDQHIEQSIPEYKRLAETIVEVSRFFTLPDTLVIDLGCSTGKLLEAIDYSGRKIGIDESGNLLPAQGSGNTEYLLADIREFFQPSECSLILSIFTLQFIPRDERQKILNNIYESLIPGGAFIWAEKTLASSALFEQVNTFAYYDHKRKSFTPQQIMDKERDLRKLMWVNTTEQNLELADNAGFTQGQIMWKFLNFECYLLVKGIDE